MIIYHINEQMQIAVRIIKKGLPDQRVRQACGVAFRRFAAKTVLVRASLTPLPPCVGDEQNEHVKHDCTGQCRFRALKNI
jgi:hypothetical protein